MFIFERLLSKDLEKVYYLIRNDNKGVFKFYTQDAETIAHIISSDNWEDTFFDIYTTLLKTVREELSDDMLEWKVPLQSDCVSLDYNKIALVRKQRIKDGKRTRIVLQK